MKTTDNGKIWCSNFLLSRISIDNRPTNILPSRVDQLYSACSKSCETVQHFKDVTNHPQFQENACHFLKAFKTAGES